MPGGAALLKLTENEDGSTNWWRVLLMLAITFLVPALFRCIRTVEDGEVAGRTRWGKAVRYNAEGKCKHKTECECLYKMVYAGPHFVIYKVHSFKPIGVRPRTQELSLKELTHGGKNFNLGPVIEWQVCEEGDHGGRAIFNVYDPNKKDDKNAQLCEFVDEMVSDQLNRAYARTPPNPSGDPVFLTLEDLDEDFAVELLKRRGVLLRKLLYPRFSLDGVERQKEGLEAIAKAISQRDPAMFSDERLPDGLPRLVG